MNKNTVFDKIVGSDSKDGVMQNELKYCSLNSKKRRLNEKKLVHRFPVSMKQKKTLKFQRRIYKSGSLIVPERQSQTRKLLKSMI